MGHYDFSGTVRCVLSRRNGGRTLSSALCGRAHLLSIADPCHLLRRSLKFTRKLGERISGGEDYALSEMMGRVALSRAFYAPFVDLSPGMVSLDDCDSLRTHSKTRRLDTGK